jgi:TIR domain/Trehalose utilisation
MLARKLLELEGFTARTLDQVPDDLDPGEALVINNVPSAPGSIPVDRVLRFVETGGGLFAVHDTVFPYWGNRQFIAACGIRQATGAMQVVVGPEGQSVQVNLARGDPMDPMACFPVVPRPESVEHPILEGIGAFELAEEVWAQNLAPGVRTLMVADVGDRVFAPERFREGPVPIAACRALGEGRVAFFSLGHFAETYSNPNFVRLVANAIRWVTKETSERDFKYDLFLSYSSRNRDEARTIQESARGLSVFMDEKDIQPGAIWDDVIRNALMASRELAVLASPDSLDSEWVQTEWGAAWVLGRTITPILFRVDPRQLPDRLKQRQCIDFHRHAEYLEMIRVRSSRES